MVLVCWSGRLKRFLSQAANTTIAELRDPSQLLVETCGKEEERDWSLETTRPGESSRGVKGLTTEDTQRAGPLRESILCHSKYLQNIVEGVEAKTCR